MRRALLIPLALLALAAPAAASDTLYVANDVSNTVSSLRIGANGALSSLGAPVAGGTAIGNLSIPPGGNFLYGTTRAAPPSNSQTVIFPILGDVAASGFASLPTQQSPSASALTPNGRFLYVSNGNAKTQTISGYAVSSEGGLTALPGSPFPSTGTNLQGLAITPDGRFLYVASSASGIRGYAIGADGTLTPLAGFPVDGTQNGTGLAVNPAGDRLFMTDTNSMLRALSIGPDGSLQQLQAPVSSGGISPGTPVVTPDGRFVYVPHSSGGGVLKGFTVAADGTLTPAPGGAINLGAGVASLAATLDGRLYAALETISNNMIGFTIGAEGSLSVIAGSPLPSGGTIDAGATHLGSLRLSPDQPPFAQLSAAQATADGVFSFDASKSVDIDGTIARYEWDFGDGTTLSTTGPQVQHRYAAFGTYTATVTLVDNLGCSVTPVYTGQSLLCNGGPVARKASVVTYVLPKGTPPDPQPSLPDPRITDLRAGKRSKGKTPVSFNLNVHASVRATVQRAQRGRRFGKRCLKQTQRNRKRRACTRYVTLGTLTHAGKQGANSFTVGRKVGRRSVTPGSYRLSLVATNAAGKRSPVARATFKVPRPRRGR